MYRVDVTNVTPLLPIVRFDSWLLVDVRNDNCVLYHLLGLRAKKKNIPDFFSKTKNYSKYE